MVKKGGNTTHKKEGSSKRKKENPGEEDLPRGSKKDKSNEQYLLLEGEDKAEIEFPGTMGTTNMAIHLTNAV
jgi:hypothetical protein